MQNLKGLKIWLGHEGQVAQFTVEREAGTKIALSYTRDNVTYLKFVPREKFLKILAKVSA